MQMPTTPLTSSSTCTPRRAKASLTVVRMSSDTCSRSVYAVKRLIHLEPILFLFLRKYNVVDDAPVCPLLTGGHSNSLWPKLWHKDGRQDRYVAHWETQGVLQARYVGLQSNGSVASFENIWHQQAAVVCHWVHPLQVLQVSFIHTCTYFNFSISL